MRKTASRLKFVFFVLATGFSLYAQAHSSEGPAAKLKKVTKTMLTHVVLFLKSGAD